MSDVNTRRKFLGMELPKITEFLNEFSYSNSSIKPSIEVGPECRWVKIKKFPLPDTFHPDYEDIAMVTAEYPDFPPGGIHVVTGSPNVHAIENLLGGHVYEDAGKWGGDIGDHVEDLPGWTWICFHYKDWTWNFNPGSIMAGDCLYKFIISVQANLSGAFHG
jgi:hypothetical protein